MLETFTVDTFARHLGGSFRISPDDSPSFDAELIEATALGSGSPDGGTGDGRRRPFSIVFRGPANRLLPQRIYRVEHEAIGSFELFLVPIGPDGAGMRYEAVFA